MATRCGRITSTRPTRLSVDVAGLDGRRKKHPVIILRAVISFCTHPRWIGSDLPSQKFD